MRPIWYLNSYFPQYLAALLKEVHVYAFEQVNDATLLPAVFP